MNTGAIPKDWKLVRFMSIYSDEQVEGYLKPCGDIVCWLRGVITPKWFTLASKNEVKEIVNYL